MNVANALAAAAAAWAAGAHLHDIRQGLRTFTTSFFQAPGRLNYLEVGGVRVVIDYCHNVDGMRNLADFTRRMNGEGDGRPGPAARRSGARRHRHARRPPRRGHARLRRAGGGRVRRDHHPRGPQPPRPRARRASATLVADGIRRAREDGSGRTVRVDKILDELSAVRNALRRANPGDLVVMCVDDSIASTARRWPAPASAAARPPSPTPASSRRPRASVSRGVHPAAVTYAAGPRPTPVSMALIIAGDAAIARASWSSWAQHMSGPAQRAVADVIAGLRCILPIAVGTGRLSAPAIWRRKGLGCQSDTSLRSDRASASVDRCRRPSSARGLVSFARGRDHRWCRGRSRGQRGLGTASAHSRMQSRRLGAPGSTGSQA